NAASYRPCDFSQWQGARTKSLWPLPNQAYNRVMRFHKLPLLLLPFCFLALAGNTVEPSQIAAPASQNPPQTSVPQQEEALEQFRAEAEEGIKHMLVSQIEAWNHRQLEGFMQGYWHSPELTFFSGASVTKGWEPTLLRYRQRYQSQGKE